MKFLLAFTVATAILLSTVGEAKAWIHGTKPDAPNGRCPAWIDGTPVTIPTVQTYMNSKHPGHGYYTAQVQGVAYAAKWLIMINWAVNGRLRMDYVSIVNTCPL